MRELPKLKPVPLKHRLSFIWLEKGHLFVEDGTFQWIDHQGHCILIPVGKVCCIFLEPGTTITHAAVGLAATTGTLLIWVGEGGTKVYSSGQPGGARSDKLLYQAQLALDPALRLKVVRAMFAHRFGKAPERRNIEQLRSDEGNRVKALYKTFAQQYGLQWHGRKYDPKKWPDGDLINRCISVANACLYGISEAAVLAAGYAPAMGFLHTGKPLSFVYDIADLFKFETSIPVAFRCAAAIKKQQETILTAERLTRYGCRDMFRQKRLLERIIPTIEQVLAAGEIEMPQPDQDHVLPAIAQEEPTGDDGHRH